MRLDGMYIHIFKFFTVHYLPNQAPKFPRKYILVLKLVSCKVVFSTIFLPTYVDPSPLYISPPSPGKAIANTHASQPTFLNSMCSSK